MQGTVLYGSDAICKHKRVCWYLFTETSNKPEAPTMQHFAPPGKLWAELYSQVSESEQSKPFQKHCQRWDMLVIAIC